MKRNLHRSSLLAKVGAVASAFVLGGCLTAGAAFADAAEVADATNADLAEVTVLLPESLQAGLHTDYVASYSGMSLMSTWPSAFDLRHYNGEVAYDDATKKSVITGGINYVSPVKLQNPFGSCWAFACTAASETSMLTELDKEDDGAMNGSVDYEKAASGEAGATAFAASDLSERHLAYFAFSHPKTHGLFSSQAGEGAYLTDGSTDTAEIMDAGGMLFLGMSVYSSGIGPVPESIAPYVNDEGWIQVPSTVTPVAGNLVYKYFLSYEAAKAYMDETWTDEAIAAFNKTNDMHLTKSSVVPRVAKIGTWSVDGDQAYGVVAELCNSNIIASNKNEDGSLTEDEMDQMKRELNEGHPLSIAYTSDQSRPSDTINSANSYINTATWAQYTYTQTNVNHAVTIVGYDDNYSAENFTHNVYKQNDDGDWVIDTENTAKTTPAGNGAWIVKNSWGCTDQEDPLQQLDWGIDGTGYFYLSYYDKNISNMESFEYDLSAEAQERESYDSYQYDLANVNAAKSYGADNYFEMVNVFDGPEAGESSISVRDLGCLTGSPNATTVLSVYVMADFADAASVIETGDPEVSIAMTYDSAGFHRVHLDSAVTVSPGQKFAVTQSTLRTNGQYEYIVDTGTSKEFADAYNAAVALVTENAIGQYCVTVVNKGESLVKYDGEWCDWTELLPSVEADETAKTIAQMKQQAAAFAYKASIATSTEAKALYMTLAKNFENLNVDSSIAVDNWTLKAYADDVDPGYQRGDVNDNDAINIADAQIVLDMCNGAWTVEGSGAPYGKLLEALDNGWDLATLTKAADANGDAIVDATDARAVQHYTHAGFFG